MVSSNIRNKYTYATCSSTACGVGSASSNAFAGSAAGNDTRGIFALGGNPPTNTRNKYTYATCTSTACGVAVSSCTSFAGRAAAGNSTRGIFALGFNSGFTQQTTRNKYTYACCTSTAAGVGAASVASCFGSATSWATCVNTP